MSARTLLRIENTAPGIRLVAWSILLMTMLVISAPDAHAAQTGCPFSTCGNGSDGALNYTGQTGGSCGSISNCIYFDPVALGLHGTGDAFCVYNFTSITIPAGLTILVSQYKVNCPVYWLSQGDVNITGTLSLVGQPGAPATYSTAVRVPAPPGSGGFTGGVGGGTGTGQNPTAGSGPGGGAAGTSSYGCGTGGTFSGNSFLVPLIGGSGGGGSTSSVSGQFSVGGGAGGGAILIASSTQIIVSGTVTADGGPSGPGGCAGAGSGGAIRLVSITISGSGFISSEGWSYGNGAIENSTAGYARLEATTISFAGSFDDLANGFAFATNVAESNPLPLFVPTAVQPSVQVTQIDGMSITENPFSFPDVTINTGSQVPVVITGHNVPLGTVPYLYIYSDTSDQQAIPCSGGLAGTLATSSCTVNIAYPFADSRGFVKASWSSTPP